MRHLSVIVHSPRKPTPDSPWHSVCVLVAHLSPTVCDPNDCSLPGRFSRQEHWTGLPLPPPGDLPNPGVKPRSPALQVDSLLAEAPGSLERSLWKKSMCPKFILFRLLPQMFKKIKLCPTILYFMDSEFWALLETQQSGKTQHCSVFQPCFESWNQQISWILDHGTSSWKPNKNGWFFFFLMSITVWAVLLSMILKYWPQHST